MLILVITFEFIFIFLDVHLLCSLFVSYIPTTMIIITPVPVLISISFVFIICTSICSLNLLNSVESFQTIVSKRIAIGYLHTNEDHDNCHQF